MKLFTSEEFAKSINLKIGDIIKIHDVDYVVTKNYMLRPKEYETSVFDIPLYVLIDREYSLVGHIKTPENIGDLKCGDGINCNKCPLRILDCTSRGNWSNKTLYSILERTNEKHPDKEIYDIVLKRLNKKIDCKEEK